MRPSEKTQTGTGSTDPIMLDMVRNPFQVGFGCIVTGTVTYTIEHTFDNLQEIAPGSATWFPHPDAALVGATSSQDGTYAFPVRAFRARVTAGTGSVTVKALQAGHRGA